MELQPRKRKHFIVALLPWRGGSTPGTSDVAGLVPLERALSGIQIFTEGHLQVIGNAEPNDEGQERFYGPGYVGKVTSVWGWKATIWHAQDAADGGVSLTDPD
ncbi:hypothetical protein N2K95_14840 [Arthrobacter zhaoxinii]|uniref:Uncharacterized protein n=1 Tax=Arthrobacter zhaoxinii TaxID=2964616 RepID=A0ABY5YP86_9MICC|nr:hypothetical protein [Arthrobacter zhaoxinii]UWX96891.1 hypothetical protein N2K95_14840 [Arthrobacter zhaoxinii]